MPALDLSTGEVRDCVAHARWRESKADRVGHAAIEAGWMRSILPLDV